MPCFFPLLAVQRLEGQKPLILKNRNAKLKEFGSHEAIGDFFRGRSFDLPCGSCIGCRLKYSYNWAVRCLHESAMHERSIFLTLTYAPEHVPSNHSLDKEAVPRFIAELRRELGTSSIKYFHCGEYGTKLSRPHYHVLIFGFRPDDSKLWKRGTFPLYTSPMLERLWPYGFCPFGDLSFESAAYTARYATKKITGKKGKAHYERVDPSTGEVFNLQPEYATMSNRGGIGRSWLLKYIDEVYPSDTVLVRGRLVQPPRFYDRVLEQVNPDLFKLVKENRLTKFQDRDIYDIDQLRDMHRATQKRFDNMMRSIE